MNDQPAGGVPKADPDAHREALGAPQPSSSDTKFFWAVGGLLLLIIAILAGLWLKSERRARQAEADLAQVRRIQESTQAVFQELFRQKPGSLGIDRQSLTTRPAEIDGHKTTVLLMPAELGEAIGFQAGDVILVEQRPATAPATQASAPTKPASP